MKRIVLVNDDGLDSLALLPTIKAVENIGEVEVIVPLHNQSWTSKMNTRTIKPIPKFMHKIEEYEITVIDGLPADCSNYGLYRREKPDLLISGINLGHNVGLSAFLSSGTVGAALEGLLAGVPSIAISAPYFKGEPLTQKAFELTAKIIPKIIKKYIDDPRSMALLALNLPLGQISPGLIATNIGRWIFGKLFTEDREFITPINYPDLNQNAPTIEYTDTWCRKHKLASLVALDQDANRMPREVVHEWLIDNELLDRSVFDI